MNDPDRDLIELAQKGDKSAFGKLVDRYYEMVYIVTKGVLRNHEAARDATQETFIKAYRDISKFKGQSKFKTWLYRVAFNAAIDLVRKRKPVQSIDATDASSDEDTRPVIITDKSAGPRDQLLQAESHELVREAINELSEEHRVVLILREWDEMSYEEIAETVGIEVGTVMSRLHYARKKLSEVLGTRLYE